MKKKKKPKNFKPDIEASKRIAFKLSLTTKASTVPNKKAFKKSRDRRKINPNLYI